MPVDKIRVDKRHRLLGDIARLAESIEDLGLLHPITVDQEGHLRPLDVLRRALLRDAHGNASTPLGQALDRIAADERR
jgi:hypothetical protein